MPASSLVVPVLAGIGGAAFLVWKPGVARSMVGSPRAAGFTLVVATLVLGAGWLLPRLGRGPRATALVQLVPVLAAFLLTVAPAFRQVTVDEPFPIAVDGSQPTAAAANPGAPQASQATMLGRADIRGVDHRASGDVLLLRHVDGSLFVRVERSTSSRARTIRSISYQARTDTSRRTAYTWVGCAATGATRTTRYLPPFALRRR